MYQYLLHHLPVVTFLVYSRCLIAGNCWPLVGLLRVGTDSDRTERLPEPPSPQTVSSELVFVPSI